MALEEVASGNQCLRAGKSDGPCGEPNAKAGGAERAPCPADGMAAPPRAGSWAQPWLSQRRGWKQGKTGLVLSTAAPLLFPSNDGVHIMLSAVGDAWVPCTGRHWWHCRAEGLGSCCPALRLGQLEGTGRRWGLQAPQWGQGGLEEWGKGSLSKKHSKGPWWADREALGQGLLGKLSQNHGTLSPRRGRCMRQRPHVWFSSSPSKGDVGRKKRKMGMSSKVP